MLNDKINQFIDRIEERVLTDLSVEDVVDIFIRNNHGTVVGKEAHLRTWLIRMMKARENHTIERLIIGAASNRHNLSEA